MHEYYEYNNPVFTMMQCSWSCHEFAFLYRSPFCLSRRVGNKAWRDDLAASLLQSFEVWKFPSKFMTKFRKSTCDTRKLHRVIALLHWMTHCFPCERPSRALWKHLDLGKMGKVWSMCSHVFMSGEETLRSHLSWPWVSWMSKENRL